MLCGLLFIFVDGWLICLIGYDEFVVLIGVLLNGLRDF